jgi:hypothetical protein
VAFGAGATLTGLVFTITKDSKNVAGSTGRRREKRGPPLPPRFSKCRPGAISKKMA